MASFICALIVFICYGKVSLTTGQENGCVNMPLCQTSEYNNCLCYKVSYGEKYGICTCTYSYSLDNVFETGIKKCCIKQASFGENCSDGTQCDLFSLDLDCIEGICQCEDGYEYKNETETCVETSSVDYHGTMATIAVGTTCLVLILIIVLLILLFMHRKAKTELQLKYLRSRINARVPYSQNTQSEEIIKDLSPPNYNEIERGETPPPPFESLDCILDSNEVRGSE